MWRLKVDWPESHEREKELFVSSVLAGSSIHGRGHASKIGRHYLQSARTDPL